MKHNRRRRTLTIRRDTVSLSPDQWTRLESNFVLVACPECREGDRYAVNGCEIHSVCRACKLPFSVRLLSYGASSTPSSGPLPRQYRPEDDSH